MPDICRWSVCFVHLQSSDPKFFGFAEYLAAVALIALAWTIADFRYKFRVATAPVPLQRITFIVVSSVGSLTLLTDLWRAEGWLVPRGNVITPSEWQALLGAAFLGNFILWLWFAFARPTPFGRWNSDRFARETYRVILKGSLTELPEIADELISSAKPLIRYGWTDAELEAMRARTVDLNKLAGQDLIRQRAHEILLMFGDRKFCRHVVNSSPATALAVFREMASGNRYRSSLGTFAKNVTTEAIANKDSFAYHETSGYDTGFIGYARPLTSALYGNYAVVRALEHVFDVHFEQVNRWDSEQWEAYCGLVLTATKGFVARQIPWDYPTEISRAIHTIQTSCRLLKSTSDDNAAWQNAEFDKLRVFVTFATDFVKALDPLGGKGVRTLRKRADQFGSDIYDIAATLMLELIFFASSVKGPRDLSWSVQHNMVWGQLFVMGGQDISAMKIVLLKLRRMLYEELLRMNQFPNFKGTRLLGLMLNVMGFSDTKTNYDRQARP